MQLRPITTVLLLAPCALAGDRMTIRNGHWQKHGVTLVPATEYTNLTQLVHLNAAAAVKDLAPVSFVLQNRTGRAIHAYRATWTYTPPGGKPRKHSVTQWRFAEPILARADVLLTPAANFGQQSAAEPGTTGFAALRQKYLAQNGEAVEAELSAILLDDGGVLGEGAEQLRATATAHLNAIRDLARELAAAPDLAAATALLEAKAAPRNNAFTPGVPVRLTRREEAATAEEFAARYYGDQQQSLGRRALTMLRKHGLEYSRTMISAEAAALPSYAVVFREEGGQ